MTEEDDKEEVEVEVEPSPYCSYDQCIREECTFGKGPNNHHLQVVESAGAP